MIIMVKFKLLLVLLSISIYTARSDITCLNNGYVFSNGSEPTCLCKNPNYIGGDYCEEYRCINYGKAYLKSNADGSTTFDCECPIGFTGPHCEPVTCVNNTDNSINTFNPIARSFSIFVTLNDFMLNLPGDNVTSALIDLVGTDSVKKAVDTLYLSLNGDSTIKTFPNPNMPGLTDMKKWLETQFQLYLFEPTNDYTIKTIDILNLVKKSSPRSSLLIITNVGLDDYNNTGNIDLILETSIARQIEINVIVASQYNSFQNVYFNPGFKPLIDLTEKTLGSFITPYPTIGPPYKDTMATIISNFGQLVVSKTVVQSDTSDKCGDFLTPRIYASDDVTDTWEIYLSVYVTDITISTFNLNVTAFNLPQGLELISDAGFWKLYKASYTKSYSGFPMLLQSDVGKPCNYRIWTTSSNKQASLLHTYLGYTDKRTGSTVNIEAITALPVTGIMVNIVGHIQNLPSDMRSSISSTLDTATAKASSRPCLFDISFDPSKFICNASNPYHKFTVESTYFEEVLPIFCVRDDNIYKHDSVNPDSTFFKNDDNRDIIVNNDEDLPTCQEKTSNPLDPNDQRTFVLLFTNYKSLSDILLSSRLGADNFANVLNPYNRIYNFNNYMYLGYTGTNSQNPTLVTSYSDFLNGVLSTLGTSNPDPQTSNETDHIKPLTATIQLLPSQNAFSDIIVISSQSFSYNNPEFADIYKYMQEKRVKIHSIVINSNNYTNLDYSGYYDLAARTAGTVVPTSDKADIQKFFDLYGGNNRQVGSFKKLGLSQTVLSVLNPPGTGIYTIQNFTITNKNNNSYYLMAALQYVPSATHIFVNGVQKEFIFVGNSLGYYELEKSLPPGPVQIKIVSIIKSTNFLINVFELTNEETPEFVVAFSSSKTIDSDYLYPSYSGVGQLFPVVYSKESQPIGIKMLNGDTQFNNGTLMERNQTCYYNYYFDYAWQCNNAETITYIQLDTDDATRTAIVTCYKDGTTGLCQNGGVFNGENCTCPIGYNGESCSDIDCYNGGIVDSANQCNCNGTNYEGPHCETAMFSCQKQPDQPVFSSILDTLVIVVDLSDDFIDNLKQNINKISTVFQQYVFVTYYGLNGDQINVQVFNKLKYLNDYAGTLVKIGGPVNDIRNPLKKALSIVNGDRVLLVWLAGDKNRCGDSDRVDNELLSLIAKNNVEVRGFTTESLISTCFRSISTLGNGLALKIDRLNDDELVNYINALVPSSVTTTYELPSHLMTFDSMSYDKCPSTNELTVYIPADDKTDSIILTVKGFTINDNADSIMANMIYTITPGPQSIKLKCSGGVGEFAYNIEALHKSRIAYNFGYSHSFITPGFAMTSDYDDSSMSFYIENIDNNPVGFTDIPTVATSRLDVDSYQAYVYELTDTTKMSCSYPYMAQLACNGEVGSMRIKIKGKIIGGYDYQRIVTGYCLSDVPCSSHARKLKRGICGCEPWWTGTDCSIPICLNGGTANKGTCNCLESYSGDNCELKNGLQFGFIFPVEPQRNILILFDVFETSPDLRFADKVELALAFINYMGPTKTYAFATNDGNQDNFLSLGTKQSDIIDAVNKQKPRNDTDNMDILSALEFFDGENFNITGEYTVSYIFYITHNSIPPTEDISSVINELASQGVGIYSAYYSNDTKNSPDMDLLLPNAALGGITGSWTTYDILVDFENVLQGGHSGSNPAPPSTTTPKPKSCLYQYTLDTYIFVDNTIPSFPYGTPLRIFLGDYADAINFDTSTPEGSRAGIANQENSPAPLCNNKEFYMDTVNSLRYGDSGSVFELSSRLQRIYLQLTKHSQGARDVPRVVILITDKGKVDDEQSVAAIAQNMTIAGIQIAMIKIGDGDFSYYDNIITKGLLFTFTEQITELEHDVFNKLCQVVSQIEVVDPEYSCVGTRKTGQLNLTNRFLHNSL